MLSSPPTGSKRRRRRNNAFTLAELMVATAIIVIAGLSSVQALVLMNSKAEAMRITSNARSVVQRNIDTAMGVPYSASQQPAILAITPATGTVYDDDGNGDNLVNVVLMRNGTSTLVNGTLLRTVVPEPNSQNQNLLRVTFKLTYTFRKRNYSYSMTTLRAPD